MNYEEFQSKISQIIANLQNINKNISLLKKKNINNQKY